MGAAVISPMAKTMIDFLMRRSFESPGSTPALRRRATKDCGCVIAADNRLALVGRSGSKEFYGKRPALTMRAMSVGAEIMNTISSNSQKGTPLVMSLHPDAEEVG